MSEKNATKLDEAAAQPSAEHGVEGAKGGVVPMLAICPPKLAESDAAVATGEWIAEPDVQAAQEQNRDANPGMDDTTDDEDDIPDGGLSAWLVVLGAWCVSFCSYGWINSEYNTSLIGVPSGSGVFVF